MTDTGSQQLVYPPIIMAIADDSHRFEQGLHLWLRDLGDVMLRTGHDLLLRSTEDEHRSKRSTAPFIFEGGHPSDPVTR
jgi:hypothetical protein